MRITSKLLSFSRTLALAALAACAPRIPPAMAPTTGDVAPTAEAAAVVFVRPATPCGTSTYTIVADEAGRFLGSISQGTRFSVRAAPGPHVYYAWSNLELPLDRPPMINPVLGLRADAAAGDTTYVVLSASSGGGGRNNRCTESSMAVFRDVRRNDARWDAVRGWLASTQPLEPDVAAGQAELDRRPAEVRRRLELGQMRLRQDDEARAWRAQLDAERAAAQASDR